MGWRLFEETAGDDLPRFLDAASASDLFFIGERCDGANKELFDSTVHRTAFFQCFQPHIVD